MEWTCLERLCDPVLPASLLETALLCAASVSWLGRLALSPVRLECVGEGQGLAAEPHSLAPLSPLSV